MADLSDSTKRQEEFDAILDEFHSTAPTVTELVKVKIAFWDKLAILNAGTLALSFSAASSFRGHSVGDGGVGYLLAAWKLLILSILLALVAQWCAVGSATHFHNWMLAFRVHRRLQRIRESLDREGLSLPAMQADLQADAKKSVDRAKPYAQPLERAAQWIGAVACISAAGGFYWLYTFARLNLTRL
jgi:hypothetical protein